MIPFTVSIYHCAREVEKEGRRRDFYTTLRISLRLAFSGIFKHGEGVLVMAG